MGMNGHELYPVTSSYDDTTSQFHPYISKARIGMNQHKLHSRAIFIIILSLSEMITVSIRII